MEEVTVEVTPEDNSDENWKIFNQKREKDRTVYTPGK